MKCPFLMEANVRSCENATFRKMLLGRPANNTHEKCSTPQYADCQVYRKQTQPGDGRPHCPLLRETLVQYCSVAPVTKYVPYSESALCRCGTGGHRYCDLYLGMANAGRTDVATRLYYAPNHMWLDLSEDGFCHVGVDRFVARMFSPVTKISFLTLKGFQRPAAVLTVRGADVQMVFPNPLLISGCNIYLRGDPAKLHSDPYSSGWMFEGWAAPDEAAACAGLIRGAAAAQWIDSEMDRLRELTRGHGTEGLGREELLHLSLQFLSPLASWTR